LSVGVENLNQEATLKPSKRAKMGEGDPLRYVRRRDPRKSHHELNWGKSGGVTGGGGGGGGGGGWGGGLGGVVGVGGGGGGAGGGGVWGRCVGLFLVVLCVGVVVWGCLGVV